MNNKSGLTGRILYTLTMAAFAVAAVLKFRESPELVEGRADADPLPLTEAPDSGTEIQMLLPPAAPHEEAAQVLQQRTPGWNVPRPERLPKPTYAPAMAAFGIVLLALGVVTRWPISVVGGIIFFIAIAKWIGELLHD
jgi:hypothetical protein